MDDTIPGGPEPHPVHPASVNALSAGTRLREFELLRVIGEGGFGIVYAARDHALHRDVAIKEYMPARLAVRGEGAMVGPRSPSQAGAYAAGLRAFVEESQMLARFRHPALVEVLQFWEDNASAYMAMPLYQGQTLKSLLAGRAEPVDQPWLESLLAPLLDALELMHEAGVYHRDISPDNVLMLPRGKPVLLDLGAARHVVDNAADASTVVLKPAYSPIEQYAEDPAMKQGPWTDLYALCALAYCAIARRAPPPSVTRLARDPIRALSEFAPTGFDAKFLDAIHWGLAVRPEQRPQSVGALRQRLGLRVGTHGAAIDDATQATLPGIASTTSPTASPTASPTVSSTASSTASPTAPPTAPQAEIARSDALADALSEALSGKRSWRTRASPDKPDAPGADNSAARSTRGGENAAPGSGTAARAKTDLSPGGRSPPATAQAGAPKATTEPEDSALARTVPAAAPVASATATTGASPPARRGPLVVLLVVAAVAIVGVAWVLLRDASPPTASPVATPATRPGATAGGTGSAPAPGSLDAAPVTAGREASTPPAIGSAAPTPATRPPPGAAQAPASAATPLVPAPAPPRAVSPLPPAPAAGPGAVQPDRAARPPTAAPAAKAPSAAVATGTVRLNVIPWAEVYVDGVQRGVSPPLKQLSLPEGRHEIELRNAGAVARRTVTVRGGRSVAVEHKF